MSRSKRYRFSKKLACTIKNEFSKEEIDSEEELELLMSALRRLGIKSNGLNKIINKEETRGRKVTSKEERTNIWNFWHENTESSTLTSKPATIRVDMVPKIQNDLEFYNGVKEIKKTNGE